ncbi:potassium-transporting ATPase subunit KdpC [[Flexibacter] sp. ATCC 35208]|uniref:potassium-transporting ATPase subunit KdpC n=1 Tax=[Flexibacter] sp. ATCC 35208 TaxID=1936242 RepID=UPI0009CE55FD|nr:potassium-transporting ATPase subunit KdpC [[Flexibacter] sp. ATCC 35208]OMP76255.1 potassium-transporting ATPase subunit C [[Flexibacter] sp. ATCC 35208]
MKKYLLPSIKLTLILILVLGVAYPLLIAGVAHFANGQGKGRTITVDGKVVGYENIGQKFTEDKYFQGRPSAVDYNAAGSGGSNKAASNPDYIKTVQERIDTFMAHNPGTAMADIPSELVTASGSGLDPDISPAAADIQVIRIAATRHIDVSVLHQLIANHTDKSWLGPDKINVLKLNIALDALK